MTERIVVVGGGFAGLHLLRHLERRLRPGEAHVILLDRNNYHLFTPLLYQVATGELPAHAVAYPLRRVAVEAHARFVQTEVESVDIGAKVVRTADGDIPYDRVVVVPGSVTNDFEIPGVAQHALFLKDLRDAHEVRRRILSSFERAVLERDPERRRRLLSFVLVGAGPVGVELAAGMRDLMVGSLRPMYPDIHMDRDIDVVLLDGADRVLPSMDPRLSKIAAARLAELRVRVILRTLVSEIAPGTVLTKDGQRFVGDTIVWAGGVRTHPLVASMDALPHARDGRLVVDASFRVGGRPDVLAFGDAAAVEVAGMPLPQLAQVAVLESPYAAEDLMRALRGLPLAGYQHKRKGDLIALGRREAAAEVRRFLGLPVGTLIFGGFPAWTVWRVNYLMQLLGVRNRATLLLEWTLSYFFSRMVSNTP